MYRCRVEADSISEAGHRLTTFVVTYPQIILAELNTHRMFSRNTASSRAVPIKKMIGSAMEDPFIPVEWGKNQAGMQAKETFTDDSARELTGLWLEARNIAVSYASVLDARDVHKQICNRLLEPFSFVSSIISATNYANFFHQRCSPLAQPEIRVLAEMMLESYDTSEPDEKKKGELHLPFVTATDRGLPEHELVKVSVARCARVSYLNHDGTRSVEKDLELHDKLRNATPPHLSPFEHVAVCTGDSGRYGNFTGWLQCRKKIADEYIEEVAGR